MAAEPFARAREARAPSVDPALRPGTTVFLIAAWFGVAGGFVEGMLRTLLRGVPGFVFLNSPDILWVAPLFDVAVFTSVATAIHLVFRAYGRPPPEGMTVGLFAWMALSGVALTLGKMSQPAALLLSLGMAVQTARWARRNEGRWLAPLRRSMVPLALLAAAVGIAGSQWDRWRERSFLHRRPAAAADAPNLLLITLDTVRADHLSAYGYARATTPNIDRFAHAGVLFESAMSNSSWTLPAHASLFTGRLPHEHKADWLEPLDARFPTLAEILSARGYATAAFAANTAYVGPEWGLARGFSRFEVYGSSLADHVNRTMYGRKLALNLLPRVGYFDIPGRKRAATVNQEFLRWLDGVGQRPFFAFLNYLETHDPYLPENGYGTNFSQREARGDLINFQFQPHVFRRRPTLTAEDIQSEIDAYDACLASLDAQLGHLFDVLSARGLASKTLIIVTADHGEAFGNHDLFGHGNSLYIETLHVPLIVVWPAAIPAGIRVASTVSLHRVPATVLDLFGLDATFPGTSLAALWAPGGPASPGDAIMSEVSPGRFKEGPPSYPTTNGALASVITDRQHYIRSASGHSQLFAWRDDPVESRDLAQTQEGQAELRELDHFLAGAPQ